MPTIEENLNYFDREHKWERQGDEWSKAWGSSEGQWSGSVYPRIRAFLPTESILEIAPGFGRWTRFLKDQCSQLTVVDLTERCIEACKERFAAFSNIIYHVNDGKSLSMIPDRSIDFVFSFDSLVHVEIEAMEPYLRQLAQKLKSDGVGFIHHSNMGAYGGLVFFLGLFPTRLRRKLISKGILANDGWRAYSMSAKIFEEICQKVGMQCISQELVNWDGDRLIDCFSTLTLNSSKWAGPNKIIKNPGFMDEAKMISQANAPGSVLNPS